MLFELMLFPPSHPLPTPPHVVPFSSFFLSTIALIVLSLLSLLIWGLACFFLLVGFM